MTLCYNKYVRRAGKPTKEEEAMEKKVVYLVWYMTANCEKHLWGVYETEEKANEAKKEANECDYTAWVNDEEVL